MAPISWITSYPRSGNTWTRVMVASYLADRRLASVEEFEEMMPEIHQFLRLGRMVPADRPGPMVAATHFPPDVEILQLYRATTTKVVHLVRNPRDIILSSAKHLGYRPEDRREFALRFIRHRGAPQWTKAWGTWPSEVGNWTDETTVRRYLPNADLLVVRYEDLRADTVAGLQQIVEFLELGEADPDRVRRAVQNSSIEAMQEAEEIEREANEIPRARADFFVGQGLANQSLALLGEDVKIAYQQLLADDKEFLHYVSKFGYDN